MVPGEPGTVRVAVDSEAEWAVAWDAAELRDKAKDQAVEDEVAAAVPGDPGILRQGGRLSVSP